MNKQVITVTAKCPKCKKTKKYSSDDPPKHTPYCPHGCMLPMFIHKVEVNFWKTAQCNGDKRLLEWSLKHSYKAHDNLQIVFIEFAYTPLVD